MPAEVSLIALHDGERVIYKVTKRIPELQVAETKLFRIKKSALVQFHEWSDALFE